MYVPQRLEAVGLAGYEAETMSCFIAALETLEPGTVYDIGANIGVFSIVAAALTRWQVVAFEPTPELADVARGIVAEHGLACRVEQLALAAHDGTATFYLSDVTDSSSSLREDFRPHHRSIDVELQTLDRYVAKHPPAPSVLKIDTESTEPDVLRGGTELLTRERPWIICEVLAGRTEAALMSILGPLDYSWYHISGEARLDAVDEIVGDRTYTYMNWLFAPEPPSDRFWEVRARWFDALRSATPAARPPT